ncbi:hypothetical protein LL912_00975 [Niabella sp. CC-SYL272]|uniref:hypothetical protein n=1 Tax=Niabella agricola TaxID=2891571 RepID=UPI001F46C3F7|nr:hypothetical protein [Niabella agricola]MCF3107340.1 hypothetical protein [Niabella agricola]
MNESILTRGKDSFEFEAYGVMLMCQRIKIGRSVVFHVKFNSKRSQITITLAKGPEKNYFWTSVPEGRQREAEGVGALIEEYLSKL